MARNPHFDAVLATMQEVHDKKNEDYADGHNPYSNFENTATLTGLTVPQVFHVMIGIKVERLRQLASGKAPNYESKKDTILDMANYCALWLSWEAKQDAEQINTDDTERPTKSELDQAIEIIEAMDPKGEALEAFWGEGVDTYDNNEARFEVTGDLSISTERKQGKLTPLDTDMHPHGVVLGPRKVSTLTGQDHDPPRYTKTQWDESIDLANKISSRNIAAMQDDEGVPV